MAGATTRLGLIKPTDDEFVDVSDINDNSDVLDKAVGAVPLNENVTPATDDMREGTLYRERTSGFLWVARPDGVGGFTKRYIYTPHYARLENTSFTIPNWTSGNPDQVNNASLDNYNWTSRGGLIQASGLTPGETGIFEFTIWVNFGVLTGGIDIQAGIVDVDGANAFFDCSSICVESNSVYSTVISHTFRHTVANLHKYNLAFRQNKGSSMTGVHTIWGMRLLDIKY